MLWDVQFPYTVSLIDTVMLGELKEYTIYGIHYVEQMYCPSCLLILQEMLYWTFWEHSSWCLEWVEIRNFNKRFSLYYALQ